jgi:prepilin-type N-terminal cleavage/methylation domain-containing protein
MTMSLQYRRSAGFSLVELMVAMVAGLIVTGAVVAFTMSTMKGNTEYVRSARLTQELRNSLDLVTRELRRAGYDENALGYLSTGNASAFSPVRLDTAISPATTPASYQCVIYSYDRRGNIGGAPEVANGEVRGIRRVTANVNGRQVGVIEYGVSSGTTKPACGDASATYTSYPPSCNGTWCPLSDPAILNITRLAFVDTRALVGTAPNQVWLRDIGVNIQGQLAGSTEFTRGVKSRVRVRADCHLPTMSNCSVSP